MKWLFFGLGLANFLLWQIIPEPTPPLDPVRLQRDIESLEAEIAKLEKTAAWVERVNGVLANPPGGNPGTFLEVIGKEAGATGFMLLQSRPVGGEPPAFAFSGFADYGSVAGFLSSLQRKPFVAIDRLELEKRGDGKIRTSCEVRVRQGPWQGDGGGDGLLEPVSAYFEEVALGKKNLFREEEKPQPVRAPRAMIKYVGYYETNRGMTLMLEINGKPCIAAPGETFGGIRIISGTKTEIRVQGSSREEWTVRLEGGTR